MQEVRVREIGVLDPVFGLPKTGHHMQRADAGVDDLFNIGGKPVPGLVFRCFTKLLSLILSYIRHKTIRCVRMKHLFYKST